MYFWTELQYFQIFVFKLSNIFSADLVESFLLLPTIEERAGIA
jgi:hypothetical protein